MFWKKPAAWLLILIFVSLLVIPHAQDMANPAQSATRGDALHFPVFLLLSLLVFSLLRNRLSLSIRIILTAIITITLACGTEWVQGYVPGRTASRQDLIANILGIIAALTGLWIWNHSRARHLVSVKTLHALISLLIATTLSWAYFQHVNAQRLNQAAFPVLSDFHTAQSALLWKTQNGAKSRLCDPSPAAGQSIHSLEVTLPGENSFEGINYLPGSQDWSHFDTLKISLANPGTDFLLGIRIDDDGDCSRLGLRYNEDYLLTPGENLLSFPLEKIRTTPADRNLNMKSIRRIAFFTLHPDSAKKFQITRMWLE